MAKGKQLDKQTIYNIMASYAITQNYSETARVLNIPRKTVEGIVKENQDKDEFAELRHLKKEEFSDKASDVIDILLGAAKKKAEMLLEDTEALANVKITEITTAIGTLYDKRALSQGESTEHITFDLPDEVKKYVR